MKSILTFLLLIPFTMLMAQDLSLDIAEIQLTGSGDYIDYETVTLTNNGAQELEVGLQLERLCYDDNDETEIYICIGNSCFLGQSETINWEYSSGSTPYITLAAGESYDSLKFTPADIAYGSEWNVTYYEIGNESNSATLHVTIAECNGIMLSADDFAYEIGDAFPNPATDMINIPYQIDEAQAQLKVYNSIGILVESMDIMSYSESVSLNVADYSSGVYFYQVANGKKQSRLMSFVR